MDGIRFDTFTRSVRSLQTRRATMGRSLVTLAALGGGLAVRPAAAKKKKRKKKKCKNPKQPSCAATCHEACDFCFIRADGPLLCGTTGGGAQPCDTPCFSDNDCVGLNEPYCVTLIENRETGQTQQPCPDPGGHCLSFSACGP